MKDDAALLDYVTVPGYASVFWNRELIRGGGVGAYIHELIKFKRRKDIEDLQPDLEHLWIEIPGHNKHSKTLIGVMYRSTRILSNSEWFERFESLLGYLTVNWNGLLVLLGDININMLQPSNNLTKQYQSILDGFGIQQMVNQPTPRDSDISNTDKPRSNELPTEYHPYWHNSLLNCQ